MKPKYIFVFLLLLIVLPVVLAMSSEDASNCRLENLILLQEMMPRGWARKWYVVSPALPEQGAEEVLRLELETNAASGVAHHTVYRYNNSLLASFHFWFDMNSFFPSGSRISWEWSDVDSDDWGLNGDATAIKCGTSPDPLLGERCAAVVRYGPHISVLSGPIGNRALSFDEFKAIMLKIDAQFSPCLR